MGYLQIQLYCLPLKLYSQSASFRLPEEHTFQSTLPLPSVTAITGLIGAALGIKFEEAMEFKKENKLHFGIYGTHKSRVYDLWKHYKIKSKETISSVLIREVLFSVSIELLIASDNIDILQNVHDAFINPCYALSLGTSDDIAKLTHITEPLPIQISLISNIENTCLRGDISGEYTSSINLSDIPINQSIFPPRVYLLPTEYSFKDGSRKLSAKEPFTFISQPITLDSPIEGIEYNKRRFPLI